MSARRTTDDRGRRTEISSPLDTLTLDLGAACAAKRALQSALELVNRVRAMLLPGTQANALDHAARDIVVGITLLRDADSDSSCGVRKIERSDPSDKSAPSNRKGARA